MATPVQLGEYQLVEKLGEGGMGAVYKALHTKLRRTVALKVLSKDRLCDPHAIARFEREMVAVGALDHPNIVRAMDARDVEGTCFLVMEYVEGVDVNALIRACHPMPVADACEIIRQAALGLEHAFRHGLVHRDIKPSNLMLTPEGVVKILDLGLARFQFDPDSGQEVTGTGQAMGTVEYMAPEQVSDCRSVDIRADIYSLGCTLYKLLSGRTPFGGPEYKTAIEKLMAHSRDPVPPVRRLRPDAPVELVGVLDRMLAKWPAERLATPAEVADAVGAWAGASRLPVLVAQALGRTLPELPTQAMTPTQEAGSSSGFTQFMERMVEEVAVSTPPPLPGKRSSRRTLAISLGTLAVAMVCLVGVILWVTSWRRDTAGSSSAPALAEKQAGATTGVRVPEKTYLVLQWPAEERDGASAELDGQGQDMDRWDALPLGGGIRLPITPGEHKLVIRRLGYEPFEQSFTVTQGKDVTIRSAWKELARGEQPPPAVLAREGQAPAEAKMAAEKAGSAGASPSQVASPQAVKHDADKPEAANSKESQPGVAVPQESPEAIAVRKRLETLEARYAEAMKSVEALAAAWDFRGAAVELRKVRLDETELAPRLTQRRDDLKRLHDLKQKIIAKINAAKSPPRKSALGIKGRGGDVTKADDAGVTCRLIDGKSETLAWADLGDKAPPKLAQLAVDRSSPDDWLAAGLLALVGQDPAFAERCFDQARELGAKIDPYLTPLASAAFARAKALLDKGQFADAETALAAVEEKYASTPWFSAHTKAIAAARAAAKTGIHETEAEKLYAEVAELFAQKEFFELKPLVDRLKTEYARTRPVVDTTREPSFRELEEATANLGKILTVRLDGKGDFKGIQQAIDAAPSNTRIEIQNAGPYVEQITVPKEKEGITIRGKKGVLPIVTSLGKPEMWTSNLITVVGPRTTLERLVLLHGNSPGRNLQCLDVHGERFRLRTSIVFMDASLESIKTRGQEFEIRNCMILAYALLDGRGCCRNCLVFKDLALGDGVAIECGTCLERVMTWNVGQFVISNSIFSQILLYEDMPIEFCDAFGPAPFTRNARAGKGTFSADPQFRDPRNFDFRLMPTSPCIGKASDGGDIGCRYTAEIVELCKEAVELRRRGIIKF